MSSSDSLGKFVGKMYTDDDGNKVAIIPGDRKSKEPHMTVRFKPDPEHAEITQIHVHGSNGEDTSDS